MSDEYEFAIVGGAVLSEGNETRSGDTAPPAGKQAEEIAAPSTAGSADLQVPLLERSEKKPKKLSKKRFEKELESFHGSWRTFEEAVTRSHRKLVVLIEGRDTCRDRGIVRRISEFADGRVTRVARVDAPGTRERTQWFFQPYVAHLPAAGEIALFDGGWYARAALDRATGTFSATEYADVLRACVDFERVLVRSGVVVKKFWLSVDDDRDEFIEQLKSLAERWKVGTKTLGDLNYATMRDEILAATESEEAPWSLVSGPDRRDVRLELLRALTATFPAPAVETVPADPPLRLTDINPDEA